MPADPHEEYARRLEARRTALATQDKRHVALGNLRLLVLFVAVAMAIAAFGAGMFSGWWLLAPAAVAWWLGGRLQRVETERATLSRAVAFYERGLARLDSRWAGTGETGARFIDEHHLYAQDLDIFGNASLFELLSTARTRMGEDTLAAWLRAPALPDTVRARQEAVVELAPQQDLREDLAVIGENARTGVHPEALAAWGEREPILESSPFRVVAWVLSVLGALAIVAFSTSFLAAAGVLDRPTASFMAWFFMAWLPPYFLIIAVTVAMVLWIFRQRTSRIIHEAAEATQDLDLLGGVLHRLEAERFSAPRLATIRSELDIEGRPPSRRIAQLHRLMDLVDSRHNMFMAIIAPFLLWDLHLAYALEDWRRTSGPAMRRWLNAVGEMEAFSSLAAYRYEHPLDVFPEFVADAPCFDGEALGHPLLAQNVAVPNDVRISGPSTRLRASASAEQAPVRASASGALQVLVVSGSNMSGKSTLLRTIGVNAVLAQAGAPVRARRLRLSPVTVGASIRIQDSLQEGTSRFYAEITRLRQIMDKADEAPPVLFLIDEFLHGTNSHDRRIGAEAIVRGLVDRRAIGLVTTHDLALAHIADTLGPRGANVHFEDHLEDGHMHFDYRLRPGVVQKSNAIELMRSVGLDV
ncbi:MAG: DNA mismatch repair protein MutS [Luteitalea sp.]|nr:DNA mismatch repair protein MutS [Luteitalea sp.]